MPHTIDLTILNNNQTISTSGSYDVTVGALSTLTVTGAIDTNLSLFAEAGVGFTLNVENGATTQISGIAGASILSSYNVGQGADLKIDAGLTVNALTGIHFQPGDTGTLDLGTGATIDLGSTITGYDAGDTLVLEGEDYNSVTNNGGNSLTFSGPSGSETLPITGVSGVYFDTAYDPSTGATTIEAVACFLRGTRIATPAGEVAIEDLRIGDFVRTAAGVDRPIKWIGRRSYSRRFVATNEDLQPILIRAGALGDGRPRRDLRVSPSHAMLLDGHLVEAKDLVNGASIARSSLDETIEYLNIELYDHDSILAEGAPAETFLDRDCRAMFHNVDEYDALYGNEPVPEPVFCAPRIDNGPVLAAIRDRLAAADTGTRRRPGALIGAVDRADWERVSGWAVDLDDPSRVVTLQILVDGAAVAEVVANVHRADLAAVGQADGRCAFATRFDPPLDPGRRHVIIVRRLDDGACLPGGVNVVEPAAEPDGIGDALRTTLGHARAGSPEAVAEDAAFLMLLAERLMQKRADHEGGREGRVVRFTPGAEQVIRTQPAA